jgi:hypothetical protein
MEQKKSQTLEKFYVYRSLHNDESWGTVLLSSIVSKLPNISFGMKIYEKNEKAAIAKAKEVYSKLHMYDNDKKNIREFVTSILHYFLDMDPVAAASKAMTYAIEMNSKYKEYFRNLGG